MTIARVAVANRLREQVQRGRRKLSNSDSKFPDYNALPFEQVNTKEDEITPV